MKYTTVSLPSDLVAEWKRTFNVPLSAFIKFTLVAALADDDFVRFVFSCVDSLIKDSK